MPSTPDPLGDGAAAPERFEDRPVTSLSGVGPHLAARLEKLAIVTVQDLLFHLPFRYEDRTRVIPIGSLRHGDRAVVAGEIEHTEVIYRGRRALLSSVADGTGRLTVRLFHFSRSQQQALARGKLIRCFGEVRRGPRGAEMVHPEYRLLKSPDEIAVDETLTPVYPVTEGIRQARMRRLCGHALACLAGNRVPDLLPETLLQGLDLPGLAEALEYVHRPPPDAPIQQLMTGVHPCQRRLAFEELLAQHLSLQRLRIRQRRDPATRLSAGQEQAARFVAGLPFRLTGAQQKALAEISQDLSGEHPMMRLLQGDVGSGKTVVAAAATVQAAASGFQSAIMAPTELLAEQHLQSFTEWLAPMGLKVAPVTGSQKAASRRAALAGLESGDVAVAVGTHALFQDPVVYRRLALVVVDEQHRFGVHQRLALREKGVDATLVPHQLVMTATPIPRTLAMTAYADLDCSVIDELPPGRTPVTTVAVPETRREEIVARVHRVCGEGAQAYWVCPLVEESDALMAQAAEDTASALTDALPTLSVGLIHGRMKAAEKDRIMQRFKAAEIDVLVATTVIEVGVDVPNASLMIIENSERLGLAQLHQLRGRVGRGSVESHCVLLYRGPLSQTARERLRVLRETNDGFVVAGKDLELRGAGELLGTRQTGLMQMRVADLVRDRDLLPLVQESAEVMLRSHREYVEPLIDRWVGQTARYGKV